MTYHERVTFTQFALLTTAQRPNAIRERLKAERAAYRTATPWSRSTNDWRTVPSCAAALAP